MIVSVVSLANYKSGLCPRVVFVSYAGDRTVSQQLQGSIISDYLTRTASSRKMQLDASRVIPGGTQRSFKNYVKYPIRLKRGCGSKFYDIDENEYIDYYLGSGPLILGHAHPSVLAAVRSQLEMGTQFMPAHEQDVELAKKIVMHGYGDMVRFTTTGSAACLFAVRLARAFTKRPKTIKFEGAYHGNAFPISNSPPLERVGTEERPNCIPDSAGLLPAEIENTIVLPFNNIGALERVLETEGHEIAAILMEPFMRACPPGDGYLSKIRALTQEHGVLLIFDEIVTNYRLGLGGAQEYYKVKADLVTLGKIVGGGFPIGAVAGKKEVMMLADANRKGEKDFVYYAGTFNANPIACVAGLATITELEKRGVYERLNAVGDRLRKGLKDAAEDNKEVAQVTGVGSLWHIFFTDKQVYDYRTAASADHSKLMDFHTGLILRSVYPLLGGRSYISVVHTDEDVEKTINAFYESMKHIGDADVRSVWK